MPLFVRPHTWSLTSESLCFDVPNTQYRAHTHTHSSRACLLSICPLLVCATLNRRAHSLVERQPTSISIHNTENIRSSVVWETEAYVWVSVLAARSPSTLCESALSFSRFSVVVDCVISNFVLYVWNSPVRKCEKRSDRKKLVGLQTGERQSKSISFDCVLFFWVSF